MPRRGSAARRDPSVARSSREDVVLGVTGEQRPEPQALHACSETIPPIPRRPRRPEMFSEAGVEPKLDDLINDPTTAALMQRDGISIVHLRALIVAVRDNLRCR